MSDFTINDYILEQEAKSLAEEAFSECNGDMQDADQWLWEAVDSHEWVIYYHQAGMLCVHCNTDDGADWLDGVGLEPTNDVDKLHTQIAFATLYAKASRYLQEMSEEAA